MPPLLHQSYSDMDEIVNSAKSPWCISWLAAHTCSAPRHLRSVFRLLGGPLALVTDRHCRLLKDDKKKHWSESVGHFAIHAKYNYLRNCYSDDRSCFLIGIYFLVHVWRMSALTRHTWIISRVIFNVLFFTREHDIQLCVFHVFLKTWNYFRVFHVQYCTWKPTRKNTFDARLYATSFVR